MNVRVIISVLFRDCESGEPEAKLCHLDGQMLPLTLLTYMTHKKEKIIAVSFRGLGYYRDHR